MTCQRGKCVRDAVLRCTLDGVQLVLCVECQVRLQKQRRDISVDQRGDQAGPGPVIGSSHLQCDITPDITSTTASRSSPSPPEVLVLPTSVPSRRPSKFDGHLDIVGVLSDQEVADQLGVRPNSVRNFRMSNGIPALWRGERSVERAADAAPAVSQVAPPCAPLTSSAARVALYRGECWAKLDAHPDVIGSDSEIAHLLDIPTSIVRGYWAAGGPLRVKPGPSARPPTQLGVLTLSHAEMKVKPFHALLVAGATDVEVAQTAGTSRGTVERYRKKCHITTRTRGGPKTAGRDSAPSTKPDTSRITWDDDAAEPQIMPLCVEMMLNYLDTRRWIIADVQREEVWSEEAQIRFIDSTLFRCLKSAIFVLGNNKPGALPEDRATKEVVDGQQRLASIRNFVRGGLRLRGLVLKPEYNGLTFSDLPESIQNKFREITFPVVIADRYRGDIDLAPLFYERLNEGYHLTNAERIFATLGSRVRTSMLPLIEGCLPDSSRKKSTEWAGALIVGIAAEAVSGPPIDLALPNGAHFKVAKAHRIPRETEETTLLRAASAYVDALSPGEWLAFLTRFEVVLKGLARTYHTGWLGRRIQHHAPNGGKEGDPKYVPGGIWNIALVLQTRIVMAGLAPDAARALWVRLSDIRDPISMSMRSREMPGCVLKVDELTGRRT